MKNIFTNFRIIAVTAICIFSVCCGFKDYSQTVSKDKNYNVTFSQPKGSQYDLQFTTGKIAIKEKEYNGETYSYIDYTGDAFTSKKGYAELPAMHASVQLPPTINVTMEIKYGDYTDYTLDHALVPSRGTISRSIDPSSVPYTIDPASLIDGWYPADVATVSDPYIIRDVRGVNVYVYPVQYNAVKKIIRIYNSIDVKLIENNSAAVNPLTNVRRFVEPEMFDTYKSLFINYNTNTKTSWSHEAGESGDILVICTARDSAVINPYIAWKKQMGYHVTKQVVATATNVKTTISNAYTANNNLLYVQLVGDWADIKCDVTSAESAPMDPMLGCVVGSDNYPDICIGRFSAQSTADVTTQVNKTVNYEQQPLIGGLWYKAELGIGSDQGTGIGDDNEMDHVHINNIWIGRLDPFTFDTKDTAYDPGATASMVSTAVNSGVSLINYCGHGDWDMFVTTGFNNSNISSLANGDKLPIIISVACVEGEFQYSSPCFAETWLRKTNGGAVGTLMSTINQDWAQPMIGEDYINDMLTGGYTYANTSANPGAGTNSDHGKTHFGSIVLNGDVLMYAEDNTSLNTMQTWTLFGDASLQVRTDTPYTMIVSNELIGPGTFSTNISVHGAPFQNALVSIWDGINQPFSGLTDAAGDVTINHTLIAGTAVTLTITGFNLNPVIVNTTINSSTDITSSNTQDNSITVYPNPSDNGILHFSGILKTSGTLIILNSCGQEVDKMNLEKGPVEFYSRSLVPGIYFMKFSNDAELITKKIVVTGR